MDRLSPVRRSANMRLIRSENTKPELALRALVHGLGYRFRLHRKDLPGKPDLVFASRRQVVFLHGCFWHLHSDCPEGRIPNSRTEYWRPKLKRNRARDAENVSALEQQGWSALIVWECDLKNTKRLIQKLRRFLDRG
jgi:DNA mismatch endonuclease, patch repair protein